MLVHRQWLPSPAVSWAGVSAVHLLVQPRKRWRGGGKGSSGAGFRMLVRPLDSGWRAGACGHGAGTRWLVSPSSKCNIPSLPPPPPPRCPAHSSSRRIFREERNREPGVAGAGEDLLSSQPRRALNSSGRRPVSHCAAPTAIPVGPWEQGGCFENAWPLMAAVGSLSAYGIALCLCWMEITLLLTDCDP